MTAGGTFKHAGLEIHSMDIEDIETIAVLGAGNMGHGIAEIAAIAGFAVRMRDINEELVQGGYADIEWSLGKLVEHGQLSEDEADEALERVEPLVGLEDTVSDVDVIIEAVPERMDIKREVYAEVEKHAPDDAVFASNTSSLSITELSESTDRPDQFCGMHFFNPPVRMELVEVISGAHTTEETLELVERLAEKMDKTPIRVRSDSPGFIVNRVLVPLLNEAAWIVHDGDATIAEVDSTTKFDMGLPMGAFELADQVGIDVSLDVLTYLHDVLGESYAPCPMLKTKVKNEELGKKAGSGFYDYENGGVTIPTDAGREEILYRLYAVMANEVAKLVEGDVADPPEIDRAMQLGTGFPDGPARSADDVGLDILYDTLTDLHEETSEERYRAADLFDRYVEEGRGFYGSTETEDQTTYESLQVERVDSVGRITIDRPHRMNTIDPDLLAELEEAIDEFDADPSVRSILITGAGDRAFSAGADVQGFVTSAQPLSAIELSREGQRVFGKLESCNAPVIAAIDGYCLGGGMELATACDLRVASERSEFGQPEHDLGLLPGWGGTQRLRHLVGEGRAKEIIFTTERYDSQTMAEYGFVNEVVDNDQLHERARELARDIAAGPPIAQRFTKRAMLAGRDDTDAGLEVEAQGFGVLMTTDDLIEGVTAFMEDREPEFKGE